MGDIVYPKIITRLKTPVENVLRSAVEQHMRSPFKRVLVIGIYEDEEAYYGFSDPDGGTCLWDMELLRYQLIKVGAGDASDGT